MDLIVVADVLAKAGGWGVAALFAWFFLDERRHSRTLQHEILQFAIKNTEINAGMTSALQGLKEIVQQKE